MASLQPSLLCCLLWIGALAAADRDGPGPMIDTSSGRIVGLYTDRARVFRSVPYARPPVGDLRWKDPQRVLPVPGILQTTEDPPGCPQLLPCDLPIPQYICPKRVSEDCLYLNIYTPRDAQPTSNLPVMVFIHGGNFIRSYSGGLLYDGQFIANTTSIVVVTINYRLGAMGFLVYRPGEKGAPAGNYGLRDQRMALEWIQENIRQFGGDPREVTLWGQSAGAVSVSVHMSSIRSGGLFNKAIVESNPFGITLKDLRKAEELGNDFAKELGCKTLDCLYQKNLTEIAVAQEAVMAKIVDFKHVMEVFLQWTPIVDNVDLMDQPIYLLAKGEVAPMPMIVGTTSEESVFFIYQAFTSKVSPAERDLLLLAFFPGHFEKLNRLYPISKGDNRAVISELGTDFSFTCTTRHAVWGAANYTNKHASNNPIWLYVFNHSLSFDPWGEEFEYCNGHSCHAVELPFVFHTINETSFTPSSSELELADNMTRYWTNFAKTGNPNDFFDANRNTSRHSLYRERLPDWPPYYVDYNTGSTKDSACMRFKTPQSQVINDYHRDICSSWDSIGYHI